MMTKHYPHGVWITDDPLRDSRIYQWIMANSVDTYDYWEETRSQRHYCFKEARWAVMFKLMFGGDAS